MRYKLILLALLITFISPIFCQQKSSSDSVKYFFPIKALNDPVGMEESMPLLAATFQRDFKSGEKNTFYYTQYNCYLAEGKYQEALKMLDSLSEETGDPGSLIYAKSFAASKNSGSTDSIAFSRSFSENFGNFYNQMPYRKKANAALMDFQTLQDIRTGFEKFKKELSDITNDSLTTEQASNLIGQYVNYKVMEAGYQPASEILKHSKFYPYYPAIKGYAWAGVVPVEKIDERPDPTMKYKLLVELSSFSAKGQMEAAKSQVNIGLGEVARLINLHEAAGVPRKKIDLVMVIHARAVDAFLKNDVYKKKYKVDNPNLELIKSLQDFGVKTIVCGQAMTFLNREMDELVPGVKQALSAKTTLSTYQLKGYVLYDFEIEDE